MRQVRPSVPEAVEQALAKALAPVPADRFSSSANWLRALALPTTVGTAAPTPVATPVSSTAPAPLAVVPPGRQPRRLPVAAITMGLGLPSSGWACCSRGDARTQAEEGTGPKRLAVLPFENLGDSATEYFADGMTDEVRGKLSQVSGLAVIARASSNEYRKTTKAPQEIARELGADYLLTATVRWEKPAGGPSRVRVSPELIRVEPGAAPTTKWQQPFDASLTDVFQVQADIATKVASALNAALGDSARQELAAKPTANLAAYDAYLKGEAASQARPWRIPRACAGPSASTSRRSHWTLGSSRPGPSSPAPTRYCISTARPRPSWRRRSGRRRIGRRRSARTGPKGSWRWVSTTGMWPSTFARRSRPMRRGSNWRLPTSTSSFPRRWPSRGWAAGRPRSSTSSGRPRSIPARPAPPCAPHGR